MGITRITSCVDFAGRRVFIDRMRKPIVLPTLLLSLLASASRSEPIRVALADVGTGAIGAREFVMDLERQPDPPFDFPDVNELSGDYILKQEDYRINIADYFHVQADGWTGYGLNWLLERWPQDIGIFEQYAQIILFDGASSSLVLYGQWTSSWRRGTGLSGTLETPSGSRQSSMSIVSIGRPKTTAVPEPGSLALVGIGLAALAGMGLRARLHA